MKTWIKKIFGFGLASFFGDFSQEMTISLIPILVTQFVGAAQAPLFLGIISSICDGFASFLRLISGFLSDRFSQKKPLILLGYSMSALFSMLVGFTHTIWGVLFYRMLSFTGSGLREPPRDALIASTVQPSTYGRSFGLKNAMDTFGSLIGPLVTFMLIGIVSMRSIFVLSFFPGIASVFAILFLTHDIAQPKKSLYISPTFWQDFLLLPRRFVIFLIILFIFNLSFFNKLLLLSRAKEILVINQGSIAKWLVLLYTFFNFTRACAEFLIGLLSDYVNRIFLLALLGCGLFACVAFLLITPKASLLYCIFIFILSGISTAALTTLKKACAADMLPANIRGFGYGTMQASEGFAVLISSALVGFLWTHYSAMFGFSYVIALSLLAMILLLGFELTKNKLLKD